MYTLMPNKKEITPAEPRAEQAPSEADELVTIWVTRKALTQGILKVRAEINERGAASFRPKSASWPSKIYIPGEGRAWHRTEQEALDRAEKLRQNELKTLHKKVAQIEALRFTSASIHAVEVEEEEEEEE